MSLTQEDLKILTRPFAFEDHEFLNDFAYIREDAITARIEEVDPSWGWTVTGETTEVDTILVAGVLSIKGVNRTSNGAGTVQRLKWNKDARAYEPLSDYVIAENVGNAHKGALTDALKRTARLFGVGRYLLNAPRLKAEWGKLDEQSEKLFRKFLASLADSPVQSRTEQLVSEIENERRPEYKPENVAGRAAPFKRGAADPDPTTHGSSSDTISFITRSCTVKATKNGKPFLVFANGNIKASAFTRDRLRALKLSEADLEDLAVVDTEFEFTDPVMVTASKDDKGYWQVDSVTWEMPA